MELKPLKHAAYVYERVELTGKQLMELITTIEQLEATNLKLIDEVILGGQTMELMASQLSEQSARFEEFQEELGRRLVGDPGSVSVCMYCSHTVIGEDRASHWAVCQEHPAHQLLQSAEELLSGVYRTASQPRVLFVVPARLAQLASALHHEKLDVKELGMSGIRDLLRGSDGE